MIRLYKNLLKKRIILNLNKFVKANGFSLKSYLGDLIIVKKVDNLLFTIKPSLSIYNDLLLSSCSIGYLKVEEIIRIVQNLDFEYENYPNISTIYLINENKSLNKKLESIEEADEVCNNFKTEFTNYFLPAFEHYSDPKNVLKLWDSLPNMIDKAPNFPSPDNYSKIIIISKLCNDENYQKRVDETIIFFKSEIDKGEDWMQNKLNVFVNVVKYLEENEVSFDMN